MPLYMLDDTPRFPPAAHAEDDLDGLLAIGGDLRPERLLQAYASGIFPWPSEEVPLAWFSPNPRMLLEWDELRVTRSLRRSLRRPWRRTMDEAFGEVIRACSAIPRTHESGTWINDDIVEAYERLHALGFAHSVEVWDEEGALIGGLYGVSIGRVFCGESMFHRAADASKVAFAVLARQLERWEFAFLDCQLYTPHLARLGATTWDRADYLARLAEVVRAPSRRGRWSLDEALVQGWQADPAEP